MQNSEDYIREWGGERELVSLIYIFLSTNIEFDITMLLLIR